MAVEFVCFVKVDPSFQVVMDAINELSNYGLLRHDCTVTAGNTELRSTSDNQQFGGRTPTNAFSRTLGSVLRAFMVRATYPVRLHDPRFDSKAVNLRAGYNHNVHPQGMAQQQVVQNVVQAQEISAIFDRLYPHFFIENKLAAVALGTWVYLPGMMVIVELQGGIMAGSSPRSLEALALCFLVFLLPGVSGCGGNLTAPSGGPVTSPNYPGNYGNNQDCEWLITVPAGSMIRLTFHSFDLEEDYDFLRIYDGASASAALIQELTGLRSVFPIVSTSNVMFLKFTSDDSGREQGFSFSYTSRNTSVCPTVVLYGDSDTLQAGKMTSYTMTGATRVDRPVYYSSVTCQLLYYSERAMAWWVGPQLDETGVRVRDSALYADQINGMFDLWNGGWVENPDVKTACYVPQSAGSATNCTRVRLHGGADYQPYLMTTYTRTNQTSGGRPVYVSDTYSRYFLYFVNYYREWVIGPTIGKYSGDAYVENCAMTPDQIRSPWRLRDGNQEQVVWSVTASCVSSQRATK
ncbi:PREDICTED: uncharacterized protein LOC109483192 [Branchiostoma belcheri]|uniref:Uncharacterized protein LOC109483192 n=1 Tax=Branchiostoma belcheri TaxID=7741 RepID=A0A6P4ZKK5_BRABE|nr:PREDICTED: uncharacterized protein LOC109483192 [Branchiostoma belcheri]